MSQILKMQYLGIRVAFFDDFFFDLGYFFVFYHMVLLFELIEYVLFFKSAKNKFFWRFLSGAPFEVILLGFDVF